MNRCAAGGCGRWVREGEVLCERHGTGTGLEDGGGEGGGEGRDRQAAFRARLASGDADALMGRELRAGLRGVAAEPGLAAEIGAVRVALGRLLEEEGDASRLAAGVARLMGVAVQAARLRQVGGNEELQAALRRAVAAMGAEGDEPRVGEEMRDGPDRDGGL